MIFPQHTLQVSLKQLKFNQRTQYKKISVALETSQATDTIPNPRFVKNGITNFYHQKLHGDMVTDNIALLEIYAIKNTVRQMIGKVFLQTQKLQINQSQGFTYKTNDFILQYSIEIVQKSKGILDESYEEEIETHNFSDFDIPVLKQRHQNRSALVPNTYNIEETKSLNKQIYHKKSNTQTQSESWGERSQSEKQNKCKTNFKRLDSFASSRLTDVSQYKFIEPITHSTVEQFSPVISQHTPFKLQTDKHKLGSSRCQISSIKIPTRNLLFYTIVSFSSFLMGTIIKQGLPF